MFKNITNYKKFVSNFNLNFSEQCDNLGIECSYFVDDVLNKNSLELNSKYNKKCLKFTRNIIKSVDNEDVLKKFLTRILFICSYGDIIDVSNSHFIGQLENYGKIYSVKFIISDNLITCCSNFDDDVSNIVYKKEFGQNIVYYDEKVVNKYEHSDVGKTYFDITNNKTTKFYDKCGKENFRSIEKIKEDYLKNNTGEITYPEPNVFENYTNKKYFWRLDNYIICKEEMKHVFDDTDDIFIKNSDDIKYYIGTDGNPDSLEMICPTTSYGIDKDKAQLYMNKEISTEELYLKTRKRYNSPRGFEFWN